MTTIALITLYANLMNVNPNVAIAVANVESDMNVSAVSKTGDIGLFQINSHTTTLSKKLLLVPTLNVIIGLERLKEAQSRCRWKKNYMWTICFNRGIIGGNRVTYPLNDKYYKKVLKVLNETN